MTSVRKIFRMNFQEAKEEIKILGLEDGGDILNKINLCLHANKNGLLPKPEDEIVASRFFMLN